VCQSWGCGEIYEGTDRWCPTCRNVSMPQKSIRRRGVVLIICGLVLVGMMGALTWFLAPVMLGAGQEPGGPGFSGSRRDAMVVLGLFGAIALFGLGSLVAGYIQLRHGRQNWRVVWGMIGVLGVIGVIAWLIENGFILSEP
jgi:hypothetical protein